MVVLSHADKEIRKLQVKGMVDRMMRIWQFKTKKALAEHLKLHENTPQNWIQTGKIPYEQIFQCQQETGASLDYLFNGSEGYLQLQKSKVAADIEDTLNITATAGMISENSKQAFITLADLLATKILAELKGSTPED